MRNTPEWKGNIVRFVGLTMVCEMIPCKSKGIPNYKAQVPMKPGQITAKADTKQVKQFKKRFSFIVQTEYNFSDWVPIFLLLPGIGRQQTIFLIHLIFGSMVGWLDGSMVPWFDRHLWLQRCAVSGLLSCRACFSLRSNPPFCFALM